ncbi:MAG TPA: twin-arginine translocase TatA/TatE family subunit [bacterium]|jgi:sec-independent protein translocase protein TatA|nr:twin-arginine translocase TatA/TatE family subunit [bacterium]
MGDIGFPELMIILVIALVLFGGGKLPEVGRSLGSAIREFKNAMRDVDPTKEAKAQPKAADVKVVEAKVVDKDSGSTDQHA